MNNVTPFQFEDHQVRVQMTGAQPWFNANDICDVLEYANPRDALAKHVDADDVAKRDTIDSMGRAQSTNHINESGLYALILGSAKPEAKRFKKWVTAEVLPSIRKTGGYRAASPVRSITEAARAFPALFRAARLLGCDKNAAAIAANQAVLSATQVNLLQQLGHTHLQAQNQDSLYFTPTELGKRIGASARKFNLLLAEAGLQAKRGDEWEVSDAGRDFARIYDTGKRHGSGAPIQQIKWAAQVLTLIDAADPALMVA